MAGAIIQLVAYGIQDLYLTGDPQITFFKILYRRHTNFAIESVRQNFSSPANFGDKVTCTFARIGDLIGQTYVFVEIPTIPSFVDPCTGMVDRNKKFAWVRNLGFALINEVSFEIGGKLIDRQYGEFMYIWTQLTERQEDGLDKMIGNIPKLYEFSNGKMGYRLYIPLFFWFCRNPGLALPLISLMSTEVKLTIRFRRLEECYRIGPTNSIKILEDVIPFKTGDYIEQTVNNQTIYGYFMDYDYLTKKLFYIKIQDPNAIKKSFESLQEPKLPSNIIDNLTFEGNKPFRIFNSLTGQFCTPKPNSREMIENINLTSPPRLGNSYLYVNYFFLDTQERQKFATMNHEYLIEQIQFNQKVGIRSPNVKQNLSLLHPCKIHYWIAQLDRLVGPGTINDLFNFTTSHIRYPDGTFFGKDLVKSAILDLNGQQRFQERTSLYFNLIVPYQYHYRGPVVGINAYSFCLFPENHQPSATCNMSKIDTITMNIRLSNSINPQNGCKIRSYTLNYNILRIFFHLGALAFI